MRSVALGLGFGAALVIGGVALGCSANESTPSGAPNDGSRPGDSAATASDAGATTAYEAAGLSEGTPLATAVLAVVNDGELSTNDYGAWLPYGVGFEILRVRLGENGANESSFRHGEGISSYRSWEPGGDDHRFEQLSEIDALPVTKTYARTFEMLKLFAIERGYLPDASFDRERIAAGAHHSCVVRADATVACWGDNTDFRATPGSGTFRQVSAGPKHTCGIKTTGAVVCWGRGPTSTPSDPFRPMDLRRLSVGDDRACGVDAKGKVVYVMGSAAKVPTEAFNQVSVGRLTGHDCGVKADGTVKCWHISGSDILPSSFRPPPGSFREVSLGDWHACGVKSDGSVACWHDDNVPGPNHGETTPPPETFQHVSAGARHTCGVRTDGAVVCWGDNADGQSSPPPGAFRQVSAGARHTCGLKVDGTQICWGDNSDGQTSAPVPSR